MPTQSSQARFQAKLVEENQHGKLKPSMVVLHKFKVSQTVLEAHMNTQVRHAKPVCSIKFNLSSNKCICKFLPNQQRLMPRKQKLNQQPRLMPKKMQNLLQRKLTTRNQMQKLIKRKMTQRKLIKRMIQIQTGKNTEKASSGLQHNKLKIINSNHGDIMLISTQKMMMKSKK